MSDLDDFFERAQPSIEEKRRLLEAGEHYSEYIDAWEQPFPHCDPRVLHSPGVCTYCDHTPALQAYRKMCGLPFTEELQVTDAILPGENRDRRSAEAWGGNRPRKG